MLSNKEISLRQSQKLTKLACKLSKQPCKLLGKLPGKLMRANMLNGK